MRPLKRMGFLHGLGRAPARNLLFCRLGAGAIALAAVLACAAGAFAEGKGIAVVTEETIKAERPRRWAVLIGVNHYVDQAGIGDLKYCMQDMRLLAATLTSKAGGFERRNVLLMTDDAPEEIHQPTYSNIVAQVPAWLEQAASEDDVLVAFSGHGFYEGGRGYLLPATARMRSLRLTAVSLDLMRQWLEDCKAKRKILILDCCHSGAGKAPATMDRDFLAELEKGEGFVRLASCAQDQKSNEDEKLEHGVFTYYLCKGLVGNGDFDRDGRVDVDEAYRYAAREVRAWAHGKAIDQDPVKSGKVTGLITLAYRPEVLGGGKPVEIEIPEFKLPEEKPLDWVLPELGGTALERVDKTKKLLAEKRAEIREKSERYTEDSALMKALRLQESALDEQLKGAAVEAAQALHAELKAIARAWAEGEGRGWKPAHPEMAKLAAARAAAQKKLWPLVVYTGEKEIVLDLGEGVTMKLVLIPPGEFMMGSPSSENYRDNDELQHRVRITQPFYMGAHEVTVAQFRQFVSDARYKTEAEKGEGAYGWTGSTWEQRKEFNWRNPGFAQDDSQPVTCVSWNDAKAYCEWWSRKAGVAARLPTEAEWEYACRAGTKTAFNFGNAEVDLSRYGNYADASTSFAWSDKSHNDGHEFTAPVGSFAPNAFGLYDMHGNVWEWCADWYVEDYYGKSPAEDPQGPGSGSLRVLRGGSWYNYPGFCRSAIRYGGLPSLTYSDLGFRVVCSPRP